jgi:hypothetical protein
MSGFAQYPLNIGEPIASFIGVSVYDGFDFVIADDLIDFSACGAVIPAMELTYENQPDAGAALVAMVRSSAMPIIESESVSAAANRAGAVLIAEKAGFNAKERQYLAPSPAGALDGVHDTPPMSLL